MQNNEKIRRGFGHRKIIVLKSGHSQVKALQYATTQSFYY